MPRNVPDMTEVTDMTDMTGTTGTPASPDALPGSLPGPLSGAILQARVLFPRGLVQPVGGFRFSVDALLLAAFAGEMLTPDAKNIRLGRRTAFGALGTGNAPAFADLGTGCGAVGLALLLAHPHLTGTGIDIDGELTDAARLNGARLGLADRFRVLRADLAAADMSTSDALPKAGSMDMVVANPPYRRHGSGRPSPSSQRTRALFETPETLPAFAQAAARLLRTGGRSCWVYGPDRLPDLLLALRATGQEPARLRCVHARAHGPAMLVLVEARRAGKPGLVVEPPLILHEGEGTATALTDEALVFCPLLACNAGIRGR